MVTAVDLVSFLLLFTVLAFTFYPLLPFLFSFLFRWLSDMDSVLGIRVGGVLLFFTMSCNNPITPKRFYFFFITTPFTSYLWTLIPTFLLPCSPILYILFAAKAASLPGCLFCDHKRCPNVSFPTSGLGGFLFSIRFSILFSLLYPVIPGTGFSDSHLIPWSMVKDCFNTSLSSFSWFWFWGAGYYQYVRVLHTRFPVYSMDYRLVHYWWLFDIYNSPIPILAASV